MIHKPTAPSHTLPAACTLVYAFPLAYSVVNLQDTIVNPLYFTSIERHWVVARCLALLFVSSAGYAYVWVDWNRRRRKYLEAVANPNTEKLASLGVWPPPPHVELVEHTESSIDPRPTPTAPIVTRLVIGACSIMGVLSAVNILGLVLAERHGHLVPISAFVISLIIGIVFTAGATKTRIDWQKKLNELQRNQERNLGSHDS